MQIGLSIVAAAGNEAMNPLRFPKIVRRRLQTLHLYRAIEEIEARVQCLCSPPGRESLARALGDRVRGFRNR